MNLRPYVDEIRQQLLVAAESGGDDARALAERLVIPLDAALRLTLQDALSDAAEEITVELAPGSVELRLRGRDPEFVVKAPPPERTADGDDVPPPQPQAPLPPAIPESDEGGMARINLRMPDSLKARVDAAAAAEGISVNAWLVRAVSAAFERPPPPPEREHRTYSGAHRYTGWAR